MVAQGAAVHDAVEIEQAVSELAEQPFDAVEFPFAFLQAFGNKETTIRRLRRGESNKSDVGGVLQTSNIHIAVAPAGAVTDTLAALRASPTTASAKAKFIRATDGESFEAEDLASGDMVACGKDRERVAREAATLVQTIAGACRYRSPRF